jgi:hypothetical protein
MNDAFPARSWHTVAAVIRYRVKPVNYTTMEAFLNLVQNTRNYWVFGLSPSSGILNRETFRKLDLFPSSGEEGRHLLCWVP